MITRTIVLLFAAAIVSACGWHLRGTLTLPEGLNTVYLSDQSDSSQTLQRTLAELLVANGVELADSPAPAQLLINLLSYREERRVVSIGDNTLVTEYELIAEADFSIEDAQGDPLLPDGEVSVIRAYEFDQNNVLGKAEEERLIQTEMRREVAQQIIRRLRFIDLQSVAAAPVGLP